MTVNTEIQALTKGNLSWDSGCADRFFVVILGCFRLWDVDARETTTITRLD
jgi:hypothetical protein